MDRQQELEIQLTLLQRHLEQLDEVVRDQAARLDIAEAKQRQLVEKLRALESRQTESPGGHRLHDRDLEDERPPHY